MTKEENAVFYTCSLIECIGRITKNRGKDVCNMLGHDTVKKILDFADIYHCQIIEDVAMEFISKKEVKTGTVDVVSNCLYSIPSFWDIGKIYMRVVKLISKDENISFVDSIFKAYNSRISLKIDDYNSAFYYDYPENIFLYYKEQSLA